MPKILPENPCRALDNANMVANSMGYIQQLVEREVLPPHYLQAEQTEYANRVFRCYFDTMALAAQHADKNFDKLVSILFHDITNVVHVSPSRDALIQLQDMLFDKFGRLPQSDFLQGPDVFFSACPEICHYDENEKPADAPEVFKFLKEKYSPEQFPTYTKYCIELYKIPESQDVDGVLDFVVTVISQRMSANHLLMKQFGSEIQWNDPILNADQVLKFISFAQQHESTNGFLRYILRQILKIKGISNRTTQRKQLGRLAVVIFRMVFTKRREYYLVMDKPTDATFFQTLISLHYFQDKKDGFCKFSYGDKQTNGSLFCAGRVILALNSISPYKAHLKQLFPRAFDVANYNKLPITEELQMTCLLLVVKQPCQETVTNFWRAQTASLNASDILPLTTDEKKRINAIVKRPPAVQEKLVVQTTVVPEKSSPRSEQEQSNVVPEKPTAQAIRSTVPTRVEKPIESVTQIKPAAQKQVKETPPASSRNVRRTFPKLDSEPVKIVPVSTTVIRPHDPDSTPIGATKAKKVIPSEVPKVKKAWHEKSKKKRSPVSSLKNSCFDLLSIIRIIDSVPAGQKAVFPKFCLYDFTSIYSPAEVCYLDNIAKNTAMSNTNSSRYRWVLRPNVIIGHGTYEFLCQFYLGLGTSCLTSDHALAALKELGAEIHSVSNGYKYRFNHCFFLNNGKYALPSMAGFHIEHQSSRFNHKAIARGLDTAGAHPYLFEKIKD